jgi:hypothetical protein
MGSLLNYMDVKRQSQAVWGQFGESKWLPYTQVNMELGNRRDPEELRGCGIGKFAVLAAMGASLEEQIPVIKKYRDRFDLITCDKGFGTLLEHGIKPDFVQLCDCNIPYKWLEPYINETAGVKLLSTTYANIEWTTRWKGPIYLYANKDSLHTEEKFKPMMGQPDLNKLGFAPIAVPARSKPVRTIPAGSNVSNAMLIFMTGCDENDTSVFAGYEHFFLSGYDYSWRPDGPEFKCKTGNYYAFANPKPKRFYMNHRTVLDVNGDPTITSENLLFSAKWLYSYVNAFNLPVTNCSGRGMLDIPLRGDLEDCLKRINPDKGARARVLRELEVLRCAETVADSARKNLNKTRRALWL